MPNLRTLADLIKGESHSIIEGLLQKNQSVILCGSDAEATALLALQLASDVAGGREFLGKYSTCGGPVLFFDKDEQRLKRDARALDRKKSATENIIVPELWAGSERDAVRLAHTEHPVLSVVNQFPGSLAYVEWLDKAKVSTLAIFGNSFNSSLSYTNSVWVLDAKPDGYALRLSNIVLLLVKGEAGFELVGEAPRQAGQRPVFPRAKIRGGRIVRDKFGNIELEEEIKK
jgi:hypothetical protein